MSHYTPHQPRQFTLAVAKFAAVAMTLSVLFTLRVRAADLDESKLAVRNILPSATDSRINKSSGDGWEHWAFFNPTAECKKQLLVFIPGTGGKGRGPTLCSLAANEGYHVVSLAYPSEVSISVLKRSDDADAFQKARENILYGKKAFDQFETDAANSIDNRLLALVSYLAKQFPSEGWEPFLNERKQIDWSKIVLAGQSQGGGHAALLAYQHEVARVLMFGAPKDFNVHFNKPAKWYSNRCATPLDRFFSFVHDQDEGHGCTYHQQLENYRAMGLLPKYDVVNVDSASPPYRHTRLLTSSKPCESPHGSVIADKAYLDAWKYLLSEPIR